MKIIQIMNNFTKKVDWATGKVSHQELSGSGYLGGKTGWKEHFFTE